MPSEPIFDIDPELLKVLVRSLKDAASSITKMDGSMQGITEASEAFVSNLESVKDPKAFRAGQQLALKARRANERYQRTKDKKDFRKKELAEKRLGRYKTLIDKKNFKAAEKLAKRSVLRGAAGLAGRGAGLAGRGAKAGIKSLGARGLAGMGAAGGLMRAAGPVGVAVGALVEIGKAFDAANKKIVGQSKELVRGGGILQFGADDKRLREVRKSFTGIESFANDFLVASERFEALKGFKATGLKLTMDELERFAGEYGILGQIADLSRVSGLALGATSEAISEFSFNIGSSLQDSISLFDKVAVAATQSGLSTVKYIGVIQQLQRELDLIGVEVEALVNYQKLLHGGQRLTGREEATAAGAMARAVQQLGMDVVLSSGDVGNILGTELQIIQERLKTMLDGPDKENLIFQKSILESVKESPVLLSRYISRLSPQIREAALLGILKKYGITSREDFEGRREMLMARGISPDIEKLLFKVLGEEGVEERLKKLNESQTAKLDKVTEGQKSAGRLFLEPMTKVLDALKEDVMQQIFELMNELVSMAVPMIMKILIGILEAIDGVIAFVRDIPGVSGEGGIFGETIKALSGAAGVFGQGNIQAAKAMGEASAAVIEKKLKEGKALTGEEKTLLKAFNNIEAATNLDRETRAKLGPELASAGLNIKNAMQDFIEAKEIADPKKQAEAMNTAMSDLREATADLGDVLKEGYVPIGERGATSRSRELDSAASAQKGYELYKNRGGEASFFDWVVADELGMPLAPPKDVAGSSAAPGTVTKVDQKIFVEGTVTDSDQIAQDNARNYDNSGGANFETVNQGGQNYLSTGQP